MAEADQNSMLSGFHGRYLRVDLTSRTAQDVSIPEQYLRHFLGGSGLGTYILLREDAAAREPLSPDSTIVFAFSSLVGSPLTTSAKFAVVSKSPLTNRINDSLASSTFAIGGKQTGYDAIAITGKAPERSVLLIDDGQIALVPAGEIWGQEISTAESSLKRRFSGGYSFATIGPGGETQIRYATISHDGRHAGRGGSGAVLGAKLIKAVGVRGDKRCTWADPSGLTALAREYSRKSLGPATEKYRELGTASNMSVFNRLGALPTKNFQSGSFTDAELLSPESLASNREKTRGYCAACTIGCEHMYQLEPNADGQDLAEKQEAQRVRVEYESLFALGPLCGISDPETVLAASKRCDELGLDTISLGGTIAFAMECVERGLLDEPWLKFGDGDSLRRAIELVIKREGIGRWLAEGSRLFAQELGQGTIDFAPQIKGLEIPGYEPRALQTMALGFAVGSRGADHNRSGAYEVDFSPEVDRRQLTLDAVPHAVETEDKAALMDSLILCKFLRGIFDDFFEDSARMLKLVTGWQVDAAELRETARRIVAAKQFFNIQAGWNAAEDVLPKRFHAACSESDIDANDVKNDGIDVDVLAQAIKVYRRNRGWGEDGLLPQDLLDQLDFAGRANNTSDMLESRYFGP